MMTEPHRVGPWVPLCDLSSFRNYRCPDAVSHTDYLQTVSSDRGGAGNCALYSIADGMTLGKLGRYTQQDLRQLLVDEFLNNPETIRSFRRLYELDSTHSPSGGLDSFWRQRPPPTDEACRKHVLSNRYQGDHITLCLLSGTALFRRLTLGLCMLQKEATDRLPNIFFMKPLALSEMRKATTTTTSPSASTHFLDSCNVSVGGDYTDSKRYIILHYMTGHYKLIGSQARNGHVTTLFDSYTSLPLIVRNHIHRERPIPIPKGWRVIPPLYIQHLSKTVGMVECEQLRSCFVMSAMGPHGYESLFTLLASCPSEDISLALGYDTSSSPTTTSTRRSTVPIRPSRPIPEPRPFSEHQLREWCADSIRDGPEDTTEILALWWLSVDTHLHTRFPSDWTIGMCHERLTDDLLNRRETLPSISYLKDRVKRSSFNGNVLVCMTLAAHPIFRKIGLGFIIYTNSIPPSTVSDAPVSVCVIHNKQTTRYLVMLHFITTTTNTSITDSKREQKDVHDVYERKEHHKERDEEAGSDIDEWWVPLGRIGSLGTRYFVVTPNLPSTLHDRVSSEPFME